jgi:hypothetical protein
MKKILFFTFITLCSVKFATAQTEKNDWMVGGSFNISTAESSTLINFSPSAATFVADNFALGGRIGITYTKQGTVKSTGFNIGPMARFYMGKGDFRPFFHGDFSFESSSTKNNNVTIKTNGTGYFLGMGGALFINENIALEGTAGYNHSKFKNVEGSGGFGLNLGFQVYLNKNQVPRLNQ